jgi:hypothetical protein
MFKIGNYADVWQPVYANDLTAWAPELWARESVAILEESMILGGLVHRDFNNEIAQFGDIVNTRMPAEFQAKMYAQGDTVVPQDASATNIPVKLDMIADTSFRIYDVEQTYSFADLVATYLQPAVSSVARVVDRKIAGQAAQFLNNTTGGMGAAVDQDSLVETEKKLNDLKVNEQNRLLVLGSKGKADILKTALFVKANESGTDSALRRAMMGDLFGMDTYMSLNIPASGTAVTTATTTTASTAAGATVIPVTSAVGAAAGQYFTVAGDMTPLRIDSIATLDINVLRAAREATTSGAAVTWCTTGLTDTGATYPAGWTKAIHVDTLSGGPHVGQLVAFGDGTDTNEYVIVDVVETADPDYDIVLDRALENSLADGVVVNYGPVGNLNLAFNRNAITLVNRPLDTGGGFAGSNMAVASSRNISVRVATTWEQLTKSMLVSVDALFGVKTLNGNNGCVLLN